ncbi:MAG: hypothetical protein QG600_164 [Patescibacteria group bacterium]|jgi:vancomycin resistance protein YoaR|nr:hypothetical protein [Patescibacteria group bacterium]
MKLRLPIPSQLKKHKKVNTLLLSFFWFFLGAGIGLFFFSSFVYIYYKNTYTDKVYPGVYVNNVDFGGKTEDQVRTFYDQKNKSLASKKIIFRADDTVATRSATELALGYDSNLLSSQAYSIGRSNNFFSDVTRIFESYTKGIHLSEAYTYSDKMLLETLQPFQQAIDVEPINASFTFEDGKVTEFTFSKNGKKVAVDEITHILREKTIPTLLANSSSFTLILPIKTFEPDITTEEVNDMGIKERIGVGSSFFTGSIPNRIYNLTLASEKINGVLIKPGEIFSFNKVIGDISTNTGYKQAYVIQNGRTVLGDGGGVCQVSTTLFRAILNTGLPIVERNQHAYRVSYYEQDLGPGIDAAIYTPTVDFKFKNDTAHHILIQTIVNPENSSLTFELYGTSDGRTAEISKPVISSQSPAPEPLYQDDPTLPKGQIKQVDFAASGAVVSFKRAVKKDGKVIIDETFTSRYRPWQAVFLRGTKEG